MVRSSDDFLLLIGLFIIISLLCCIVRLISCSSWDSMVRLRILSFLSGSRLFCIGWGTEVLLRIGMVRCSTSGSG